MTGSDQIFFYLVTENHPCQSKNQTRHTEEEESDVIPRTPFLHRLNFPSQTLRSPQRINLLHQIKLQTLLLQLLHALPQQIRVLFLPIQQLLQVILHLRFVPDGPDYPQRTEDRTDRWDPRSVAGSTPRISWGGVEEEKQGNGVEEKEKYVEVCDFLAYRVDLGFFKSDSVED